MNRRSSAVLAVFLSFFAVKCGGAAGTPTSPSNSTTPPAPPPSSFAVPAPLPGCEPWPPALGELFAKLPLPDGLCLVREASPNPSEYKASTRRVIHRNPSPVGGEVGSIAHELCHAHQQKLILDSGVPDVRPGEDEGVWLMDNWARTREGADFLQAAGYAFTGGASCSRSVQTSCWTQSPAGCEMGMCLPSSRNPMEDAAEFCHMWYNPTGVPMFAQSQLQRDAPRRFAWARTHLPK